METLSNMAAGDDEAGERLVNEEKNGHNATEKKAEVKYMTPGSHNGDAKIDIENLKAAFVGMGKEELMQYANDPFWVKMRWILFALFWLVWLAMLGGAIAIIVLAPKCTAPTPREWWEQSPLYKIDVRSFNDGSEIPDGIGDLKGLSSKLGYLKDLGVKTVVLSSVLKSATPSNDNQESDDDNVVNYEMVDEKVGTMEEFKELAAAMKKEGLHVLMSFVPNHSSDKHPWFLKSIEGEEPYKDYYIWASPKGFDPTDGSIPLPPNNWMSLKKGSAWQYNDKRKMFYLHQFSSNQPDFNFYNAKVVDYFKNVMKLWLDNGVSGFHLDKVQYLLEDKDLRNESHSDVVGATHDQYEFLNHRYTSDLEDLSTILQQWNKIPASNSAILSITGVRPGADKITSVSVYTNDTTQETGSENSIGQLFVRPQLFKKELTAKDLEAAVNATLRTSSWPTWDFMCKSGVKCISDELFGGIQVVSMLLPGIPVTRSGAELGFNKRRGILIPWGNTSSSSDKLDAWDQSQVSVAVQTANSESFLNLYKKLVETRQSPAITYGATSTYVIDNNVFAFTRIKPSNPGYAVVFNVQPNPATVDLTTLNNVPADISVIARTPSNSLPVNGTAISNKNIKLNGKAVSLEGFSALVLRFVPNGAGG